MEHGLGRSCANRKHYSQSPSCIVFFFKGRKTSISYVTFLLERQRDWNDTQEIVPVVTLKSGNNSMWEGLGVGGCMSHSPAGHTWQTQGNMKTVYLQRDHLHSCRCNGT